MSYGKPRTLLRYPEIFQYVEAFLCMRFSSTN